jgi:V/A-type H+/Na+-transporting ATPase subunit K
MRNKGIVIFGILALWLIVGNYSPAFAQAAPPNPQDWSVIIAKFLMCFALTVALTGSVWGLLISFQALLGGSEEYFYKNIAVALMPSTQGIYGMVVFMTSMGSFATDPYTVMAKAIIIMLTLPVSAVHQGIVCATGIKSILEGKNTLANAMVSGAMPETYAVFALVMTFIIK